MNWYRVTRADGSYSWIQATSKSEASQKVRYVGEMIKAVKQVDESDVPSEAGGTTPTTPTPTTPTPTTPTPTTPTGGTTTPTTDYKDWSHLATFKERLEQQIEAYNKSQGTSFSIDKAGITEYLDKIGANERTRNSILSNYDTVTQLESSYQDYLTKYQEMGTPAAKDFADYLANYEQWYTEYQAGLTEGERARVREFDEWWRYGRKYGGLDDQYPVDIDDFYDNYDLYQQQLVGWKQQAEEVEAEYTDEQVGEWNAFKDYMGYREPGEWYPVDIADYFENWDKAQQSLSTWQQRYEEGEAERVAGEEYALDPEEAERRREEAYAESRYAAEERYRETPQYQAPFTQWFQDQAGFSGALQAFTEREYPSLKSEFQATQPRLTGFPTREEARAEATRREQAWGGWLPGKTPEIEQRYWGQRPAARGERLWMQQPTLRTANW